MAPPAPNRWSNAARSSRVARYSKVESGGRGLRDAVGEVRIEIPPGIEAVEGDTAREARANPQFGGPLRADWDLWLRPIRTGKYTIRGWIRIPRGAPQSWDESECALDLEVRSDSVVVDAPESWLADTHGTQIDPEAIDKPAAVCADCGLNEPTALHFAVTVGTDGTVRWIEPRAPDAPPEDPRVLQAAESTLKNWRFRPARIGDRAIANWAEVDVVVRPGGD